jgi:TolB protein
MHFTVRLLAPCRPSALTASARALRLLCLLVELAPWAQAQRKLLPGQVAQLRTIAIDGSDAKLVLTTPQRIEAPNWTPDGKWLVYNSAGGLLKIAADGSGEPQPIPTGSVRTVNNDHLLSPDGKTIYLSASGHLYAVPFAGGEPRRISNEPPPDRKYRCFLHGISPDGRTLAYVRVTDSGRADIPPRSDIYTISADGGADVQLTDTPAPDDGPEYSPDGRWIYFNSELNAQRAGHAQIYRMKPDGTGVEQLTHDDRVNWFPHVSPDGQWVVYLSYPAGTTGHPADKDVILRRMRPDGSEQADVVACFGGQGTINVNSWAPDSRRFAYVAYPIQRESLPAPWQHRDIGAVTVAGMASTAQGVFSIAGTLDIWGKSDGCHFVWQTLEGDGAVVARVLSIERTHYHAKGGLAMRESLQPDARHVTWVATPAHGAHLLMREETGGTTKAKDRLERGVPPVWLKLVRAGDTVTGFRSADGKDWLEIDSFTVKLPATLHVGLVASSHQQDTLSTATFDQVAVIPGGK